MSLALTLQLEMWHPARECILHMLQLICVHKAKQKPLDDVYSATVESMHLTNWERGSYFEKPCSPNQHFGSGVLGHART